MQEAYHELKAIVDRQIGNHHHACISIDGWEDHQHCETIGITLKPLQFGHKPYLLKMVRQTERQIIVLCAKGDYCNHQGAWLHHRRMPWGPDPLLPSQHTTQTS